MLVNVAPLALNPVKKKYALILKEKKVLRFLYLCACGLICLITSHAFYDGARLLYLLFKLVVHHDPAPLTPNARISRPRSARLPPLVLRLQAITTLTFYETFRPLPIRLLARLRETALSERPVDVHDPA